jgi:putative DNA primase/helicase
MNLNKRSINNKYPIIVGELVDIEENYTLNDESNGSQSTSNSDDFAILSKLLAEAHQIIAFYDNNIMCVNDKMFLYDSKTGTWFQKTRAAFLHELLVSFYKYTRDVQNMNEVFVNLKILVHKNSFPRLEGDNVLVLDNGSLFPVTGEFVEYSPKHYSLNKLGYAYDSQATCPTWISFLDSVFRDDDDSHDKIKLLQEYMGLSMTNITKFQTMLMMVGAGSNGKSVILNVVRSLVGSSNASSVPLKDFNSKFKLISLENKLVNIDSELGVSSLSMSEIFKNIVGGENVMLEQKFQDAFQHKMCVKLWAAGNTLPSIKDNSEGIYRRIEILEMNRIFSKEEQVRDMTEKLLDELPGILNWSLEGLKRLLTNDRLTTPASSAKALDNYKVYNNHVLLFLNERLVFIEGKGLKTSELYSTYKEFAEENGFTKYDRAVLGKTLKALGVKSISSNGVRYYNVALKPESSLEVSEDSLVCVDSM